MLIKLPSGNKPDNDKLLLDSGFIVLDNESKGIRVHDGSTVGGFESIGIYEPPPSPGPQELIAGTLEAGFYGETLASELINGTDLAALVGLGIGVVFSSTEPWLKFALDNKTLYIAKKPYRRSTSWNQLNITGIVYGKEVTIQGKQYICRLIKGFNNNPANIANGTYDPEPTWGSEWNRLMYPICAPTGNAIQDNIKDPASPGLGAWASYNQASNLSLNDGTGGYTWCQENHSIYDNEGLIRGGGPATRAMHAGIGVGTGNYSWRPLLELVE